ncbi:MAG: MerR family transcriptional regulator [Thermomicrobiaceae bacterium]|nr:MerR family transcriptional regulator [Thermomicrobiaceae bacterium]
MGQPDATTPDAMTIHQLAERAGVPRRRIRHYIAEGLLPPPSGRGRAAHYREEHLRRLRQIEALRAVNLGLEEIRRRLGEPSRSAPAETPPAALWRHWEIAPGIELHARTDLDPEVARVARTLARVARQLLTESREDEVDREEE